MSSDQAAMRKDFEKASIDAGFQKPERSPFSNDAYKYERENDRFVGFQLALSQQAAAEPVAVTTQIQIDLLDRNTTCMMWSPNSAPEHAVVALYAAPLPQALVVEPVPQELQRLDPEFEQMLSDKAHEMYLTDSKAVPQEAAQDERALFEKQANDARFFPAEIKFTRTKSPSGRDEYANSHLQSRWEGWQARAALPRPSEAEIRKKALDAILWMYRRLKPNTGELKFIEEAIRALSDQAQQTQKGGETA